MRKICILSCHDQGDGSPSSVPAVSASTVSVSAIPLNIAAGLARAGRRVLLVDLHSSVDLHPSDLHSPIGRPGLPRQRSLQHRSSRQLYLQQLRQKNLYHYIIDALPLSSCVTALGTNLDVMGSQGFHHDAELLAFEELNKRQLFRRLLREASSSRYDYLLFDCGPSLSLLSQNALFSSTEAILSIPTSTEGIHYAIKMARTLSAFSRLFDKSVRISRILPTHYLPGSHDARSTLALLYAEFTGQLVGPPIENSKALEETAQQGCSVFARPSPAARQFRKVTEMVVQDEPLYDDTYPEGARKQALAYHFARQPWAEVPLTRYAERYVKDNNIPEVMHMISGHET
ncbi:ParA family protein [Candidatus Woesearchaeota archaeon]|nr:ParA family protein [Candidatus Woesearchaeota archaeon]